MARNYYTLEPDTTYLLDRHYTRGRAGAKIEFITRHHLMYIGGVKAVVDNIWRTRKASAQIVIDPKGEVGQAVNDWDTAWANANRWANQRTIAIEHSNITGRVNRNDFAPASWNISDDTLISGARWAAGSCLKFGLGAPVYGKNIRDHGEFSSTGCPVHLWGPHPRNPWGGKAGKYHNEWMEEATWFYGQLAKKLVMPDGTPIKFNNKARAVGTSRKVKQLEYSRAHVAQDTFYNCGPASVQTIILSATGNVVGENILGRELGTTTRGTDYIGQFPKVLNNHIPGAQYRHRDMPNDPPTNAQKEQLWRDLTTSIDAGHGVVANIVAPPSNYPRAVAPSTIHPAYRGGTVYHYIAVMGYSDEGQRKVWVADSGFSPYGYWLAFDQLATLIPPKGYAYSTAKPKEKPMTHTILGGVSAAALNDAKLAAQSADEALTAPIPSAINKRKAFTVTEYLVLIDRAVWEQRALLKALAAKTGLDPDKIIAEAIARDNGGK